MDTKYNNSTTELFGKKLPSNCWETKLFADFPLESTWHGKCFKAMQAVEIEYVEELIVTIKEQNIPGDFIEFGIFQGAWITRLFEMTEKAGLSERKIWGFDSFQGLSTPSQHDISFWEEGMYACPKDKVAQNIKLSERPRIKLVEGFFADSLSRDEACSVEKVAFARIDCDIYEPAKECLDFLGSRLVDGSILVFDDWTHCTHLGEGKAFFDWLPSVPQLSFEYLFLGPWDHLYLRVKYK